MITLDLDTVESDSNIKLSEITRLISKSRKACILTGAGISCNAGIPDFRSEDGLYNMVKEKHPKVVVKGKDLFDISLFRDETTLKVFCTFMESLYRSTMLARPTETHSFIKTMKSKNKLLRCYTQNIDSLERDLNLTTGLSCNDFLDNNFNSSWKKLDVVQLHGDLRKLACTHCFESYDWNESYQDILSNGENPECPLCVEKSENRANLGKRLTGTIGMLRPNIVLYGENHPQAENLAKGLNLDMKSKPDLLLIFGTSLRVDGIKKLVRSLSKSVHEKGGKVIFVNKTPISATSWDSVVDYQILSDCDNYVSYLKRHIPDLFLSQQELDMRKLSRQQNRAKASKKGLLTPPSTPSKRRVIQLENMPKTTPKRKKELPSPDYTPVKNIRSPLKPISQSSYQNLYHIGSSPKRSNIFNDQMHLQHTSTSFTTQKKSIIRDGEEISPKFSPIRSIRSPLKSFSKSVINSSLTINGKCILNSTIKPTMTSPRRSPRINRDSHIPIPQSPTKRRASTLQDTDDCFITGFREIKRVSIR